MTRLIKITRSSTDHASLSVRPVAGNHCTWSSRSLTALVSVRYRCRTRVTVDLHGRSRPCLPRVGPPGTGSPSLPARSAPSSAGRNGPAAVGTMGAGLRRCGRDKRGEVVPDRSLAISDIDGLYRKIVFDCAKRWTRCSEQSPKKKSGEKKPKRGKCEKPNKKPVISGPFPADPDRLEGDKWRYVILTRLDAGPPPERPPRAKRRRRPQTEPEDGESAAVRGGADGGTSGQRTSGRWGSSRWSSVRRSSGRRWRRLSDGRRNSQRRTDAVVPAGRDPSAAEQLVRPPPVVTTNVARSPPVVTTNYAWSRPGFFASVRRVNAMTDNLLL